MTRFAFVLVALAAGVVSCADAANGGAGEALYLQPHTDGNTFACATCHALAEPAADGIRRPGHQVGDAANRPSYKNGQLTELIDAVNTCRVEWMAAPPFADDDARWISLSEYLSEVAGDSAAPALVYEIVAPPADLEGGNEMAGQDLFNESCVVCHGVDAAGTERAPALRGQFLDEETVAGLVRTSGETNSSVYEGLTGSRMPFWAEDRLSDEELLDIVAFVLVNDGGAGGGGGMGGLRECDSTHPKIGQVAQLSTLFHEVSGTAVIVDDCTIRVDDFVFDGDGVNVQFYGGLGGVYVGGLSMSEDLRRPEPYDGSEVVYAQLPEDKTLDDLDGISVWCVPVSQSFGDGLFEEP